MIAQNSGYAPGRVGRAPRRRHRLDDGSGVTSCTVLCYQISVYLVGLIAVPIMFIFNVGLYISLASLRTDFDNDVSLECRNAHTGIAGYVGMYALLVAWLLGYLVFNLRCCIDCRSRSATWSTVMTGYLFLGALTFIAMVVYNMVVTYWGTEGHFLMTCESVSSSLYFSLIANVVIGHVMFDIMFMCFLPVCIRKYQWL